jgi:hypothetical protein
MSGSAAPSSESQSPEQQLLVLEQAAQVDYDVVCGAEVFVGHSQSTFSRAAFAARALNLQDRRVGLGAEASASGDSDGDSFVYNMATDVDAVGGLKRCRVFVNCPL